MIPQHSARRGGVPAFKSHRLSLTPMSCKGPDPLAKTRPCSNTGSTVETARREAERPIASARMIYCDEKGIWRAGDQHPARQYEFIICPAARTESDQQAHSTLRASGRP